MFSNHVSQTTGPDEVVLRVKNKSAFELSNKDES